jgi:hypothetical protein
MAMILAGLLFGPSSHAQTDDGWGKWEKLEGGSQRKWTGGYSHCTPSYPTGNSAYSWECRPCDGALQGRGNYCWVAYSFEFRACEDKEKEPKGFRVETDRRRTQKRCGPEEHTNTVHDGQQNWDEVVAKEDENVFGLPNPVTPENPPSDLKGPDTADGKTVPEDDKSFHKAEKKEEPKTDTTKTDTAKTDTAKTDTPRAGTSVKTSTDKHPRKEVKSATATRRAKVDNHQPTSTGGLSPDAASAIGTGIGIGVGIGVGMEGGRMGGGDMMRRDSR